jgi:hypothetical protein
VAANPAAIPRNGSLVVSGQRYMISQEALACTFAISPGSAAVAASGGSGVVNVSTITGCNWTSVSNASWIRITAGASGSASGAVNYSVDANLGSSPRTGTMTAAGQTFTVTQSGSGIVVVAPNGGENWPKGSTQVIRWTYSPAAGTQVKIELLKGGALLSTIVAKTSVGTGGAGSFNWLVPATLNKGSDYQVRVTSISDATFTDMSDGAFSIGSSAASIAKVEAPRQSFIARNSPDAEQRDFSFGRNSQFPNVEQVKFGLTELQWRVDTRLMDAAQGWSGFTSDLYALGLTMAGVCLTDDPFTGLPGEVLIRGLTRSERDWWF